jgi:hypothetical protein
MAVRLQELELGRRDVALAPDVGERIVAMLAFGLHRPVGELV